MLNATAFQRREAHEAIAGPSWSEMTGVGHVPMSENPDRYLGYLRPILDAIHEDA